MRLSFGFVTSPLHDPEEVAAMEALGVNSLWVGGHVASRNPSPEALIQLAILATRSKSVRIGTSILLLPLYAPAIVAKQIADLDRACGGRISLGVGVGGEYPGEFRACGVPLAERGRRTDEAVKLLRTLWTAEEITHPGPFYPMERVKIHPAPVQAGGPPIIIAGRQEVAMRRAASMGDGWMPYLYSPQRYAGSVETIKALAEAGGRDLSKFEWMQFLFTNVQDDGQKARSDMAQFLGGTYNQDFKPLVDRVAAAGTVREVTARVREFVDAGARHIVFMLGTKENRVAMATRIAREIIPAFEGWRADRSAGSF